MTTPVVPPDALPVTAPLPGPAALFFGFSRIAMSGFGGVLPFAYRAVVEQRKWLTPVEFTEKLAASQLLPGPTICNVALMIGAHFAGLRGAAAALAGMITGPFLIVMSLGMLYQRYGELPLIRAGLSGMTAVAVGLIASTAIKMSLPLLKPGKSRIPDILFALLGFAGMGLLKLPMFEVIAVLAPLCIGYAYWRGR